MYRGSLASNGTAAQKHAIRRALHPQLRRLWETQPLASHTKNLKHPADPGESSVITKVGGFSFAAVVHTELRLLAEIDVLLLRPHDLGNLTNHGGDLDNRLKTLFDALRVPTLQELDPTDGPGPTEEPFHCLLQDDSLISRLNVETERWLEDAHPDHVSLVITVQPRPTLGTWGNISLLG